jgi:outer membrane receptor protein involved in Fe transport
LDARNRLYSGQPSTLGYLTGNAPNVLIAPGEVSDVSKSFQALVGRVIAGYSINENIKSYLSYARGRRPNVLQLRADAQTEVLDSENVNSFELGFKGTFANRTLLDIAAYYYDYNNFQTRSWVANRATGEYQLIVKDGGKAHAYGLESNLQYTVSKNIKVISNYAYIHARFDETDSNGNEQAYKGNTFRLTPHHTWSVRTHFHKNLFHTARLFLIPIYSFKSHHYFEDDNSKGLEQEGFGLFNIKSGIYYKPLQLELSIFAFNVFDEDYLVSAGNTGNLFGIPTFVPGTPQTFSINIRWDF